MFRSSAPADRRALLTTTTTSAEPENVVLAVVKPTAGGLRYEWMMNEMIEVALIPVDPTPDEVQYLEDRIYEFNSSATGIADGALLAFFVRERERIVAGICGNTWGGTCELRQFWVDESQRRRGLGTELFRAAEQEARRRGCTQIVLMTFSFQAPAFYERNGFEVVATIDHHPHGHRNLLMRKRLGPDHSSLSGGSIAAPASVPMAQDVSIRPARPDEQTMLESLQWRASLSNPGDPDALLANPDAIALCSDGDAALEAALFATAPRTSHAPTATPSAAANRITSDRPRRLRPVAMWFSRMSSTLLMRSAHQ